MRLICVNAYLRIYEWFLCQWASDRSVHTFIHATFVFSQMDLVYYSLVMATRSNSRPSQKFNALLSVSHIHSQLHQPFDQTNQMHDIKVFLFGFWFWWFLFFLQRLSNASVKPLWAFQIRQNFIFGISPLYWRHCVFYLVHFSIVAYKFHSYTSCY